MMLAENHKRTMRALLGATAFFTACGGAEVAPTAGPIDPAGVDIGQFGLTEAPCGLEQHLASVVTADRVYNAFCASVEGSTSVLTAGRAGAAVDVNATSALEHYLAITPKEVAVPEALERAAELASTRALTNAIVKYIHPDAEREEDPSIGVTTSAVSSCTSQSFFESNHCDLIDDWINSEPEFMDTHQWCSGLLGGDAQRTSSVQGVPGPYEGRIRVVACGDDVLVRRYYKNPLDGSWWNAGNTSVASGNVLAWTIFSTNAQWCPGGFDPCQYASDLRFRVEPTAGAQYRYTGGFVNFEPEG